MSPVIGIYITSYTLYCLLAVQVGFYSNVVEHRTVKPVDRVQFLAVTEW